MSDLAHDIKSELKLLYEHKTLNKKPKEVLKTSLNLKKIQECISLILQDIKGIYLSSVSQIKNTF